MVIMERVKNTPKISEDNDKFEFTGEQTTVKDETGKEHIVYRIRAKKDIIVNGNIVAHKGDLGGFIEKEENLDYKSNAWVSGNAKVYGDAKVSGNALIDGNAQIYGNAQVFENARVSCNAQVYGNALVLGDTYICGDVRIYGKTLIHNAFIFGYGETAIHDIVISGDTHITIGFIDNSEVLEAPLRDRSD